VWAEDRITEKIMEKALKTLQISVFTLSMLILGACAIPNYLPLGDASEEHPLSSRESVTLHFFTNINNFNTGVALQAGSKYQFEITLLSHWQDGDISANEHDEPLNAYGFANSVMPFEPISLFKRSRHHNWFELMLMQPNCKRESLRGISDLNFDEASGSYNFVATCDGKLTLFVNDSYGFYGNNLGFASISLSRVN
jgi:hypothetical protein